MTYCLPSTSSERPHEYQGSLGGAALLVEHPDAAHNLARWLMRNETEAEDLVQEAYVLAISHSTGFRGALS
jgi:DNA-directed RNA polymerase specialized sigma24 family protein